MEHGPVSSKTSFLLTPKTLAWSDPSSGNERFERRSARKCAERFGPNGKPLSDEGKQSLQRSPHRVWK
ncbi:hypothetical protein THTE_1237 [Thermogutta terrifontis]|uniref:Uncharacterized protein n=1 Tax=Thermogutta terrifontis TaxID=1331910 RepID=A0A286RD08_9BACT|nr:hypothetical protein THTE_1237 [Thermogutta terrifontis]